AVDAEHFGQFLLGEAGRLATTSEPRTRGRHARHLPLHPAAPSLSAHGRGTDTVRAECGTDAALVRQVCGIRVASTALAPWASPSRFIWLDPKAGLWAARVRAC